ncbi:type I phosphodiesterase/nucleotide pyrophosphatase [Algoriphagus ratkowskyi]|uniref:Alkaline phosphatase n=1 Tax=Algoriphagus ratkowskyi TaxID=57028 RepID=A0A2W7RLI2_9BACT|nr:alkaline phosphatase [Algoriphagus ratkowskyi]PZX55449.1 type I phosphodiesterase/nucleotide pyrophosphatase [Algoriphagus ratkowskyi]TXD79632.1 alkaline phosphatase [Algoriphagus ratkowskyi]
MKRLFIVCLFLIFAFQNEGITQVNKAKHVILIGFDGLGSYAIPKATMPNLNKLMESGSYSMEARTVLPSSSAVNWASMLMGAGPTAHGFTEWGSKTPEILSHEVTKYGIFPSIFSLIRDQIPIAKTAVIFTWEGIGYLVEQEAIDLVHNSESEELNIAKAIEVINKGETTFMFLHLSEPDGVGHNIGHDTPEYYKELETVDAKIGQLIDAISAAGKTDDTIILLSSDHGGVNKGHGGKSLDEIYIPWVISGPGVKVNHEIKDLIMTYDTGATIAWILGLDMPKSWRGKPVEDSFNSF